MPPSTANILRVYYTGAITSLCGCCGEIRRMGIVDLDRQQPVCQQCLPATLAAAEALRAAGIVPPDTALAELDP